MSDCDMVAALNLGDSVIIADFWSVDHSEPKTDEAEGGTNDLIMVSGGLDSNNEIDVTFKRKLVTGDIYDNEIYPDEIGHITWGYRDNKLGWSKHSYYSNNYSGSAGFTFATKESEMYFLENLDEKFAHGNALTFSWLGLAVIGILAARYFRHNCCWVYVHTILLLVASLITIINSSRLYSEAKFKKYELGEALLFHSRLGQFMMSLVIGECIFGFVSLYFVLFTKNLHGSKLMGKVHKAVGYTLLISGLINCFLGWGLYIPYFGRVGTIGGIIIIIIVFLVFQIYQTCKRNRFTKASISLPEMTHVEAMEKIRNGSKYMFADDLVINVRFFGISHPGGAYMINDCIGEDTGKYMVGCSSYGAEFNPFTHSEKAFSFLKNLAIARIPYPSGYIITPDTSERHLMEFVLLHKENLNQHTYLLYFKSDFFKMPERCTESLWLGKHFLFIMKKRFKRIRRYYSSLFVDLDNWKHEIGLSESASTIREDGLVKFIVKVYQGGLMTPRLDDMKVGETLTIKGPLGPGLLLEEFKGNYLAFAGGTGLVPFLDLVHMACKLPGKLASFHLTLFVFFRNIKDGFAFDILEKIASSNEDWFRLIIVVEEYGNKAQVPEMIKNELMKEIKLAWICGPSGFNRNYANILAEGGVKRDRIIVM